MNIVKPDRSELENMSKTELVDLVEKLFDLIESLSLELKSNKDRIASLEKKVQELGNNEKPRKNSTNSSQSPAIDLSRKRKKGNEARRKGPPKGHKGSGRKLVEKPDFIVNIPVERCPRTHESIASSSKSFKTHQLIDIEPLQLRVIELRKQTTTGPDGKTVTAPNPDGVKSHQRYGPNLKKYISYLRFVMNTPWEKIRSFFRDFSRLEIGVGTIDTIFKELMQDLNKEYDELKTDIRQSEQIGCDETGIHVMGTKWWVHLVRSETTTLFVPNKSRGHQVLQNTIGEEFNGWLVSDFWGGYSEKFYPNAKFQKCTAAHLLRDLKYAMESEKGKGRYAENLYNTIFEAFILKKYFKFGTPEYWSECDGIEKSLDELLDDSKDTMTDEGRKIKKRLKKFRYHILNFLYYKTLPYDNNASEREIRDFARVRKISGSFTSESGIQATCIVKSIISTYKKRGIDFINRLGQAFGETLLEPG